MIKAALNEDNHTFAVMTYAGPKWLASFYLFMWDLFNGTLRRCDCASMNDRMVSES
jgi:hypothetical protein